MDLKLGCVVSLSLLILLVAYGTEARKMAEGSLQGKRLNFPVADEVVQRISVHSWIYDNQGENGHHKTEKENTQVPLSSNNKDLENKDDNHFWIYNNQGEIAQHRNVNSDKENGQVQLSSENNELENKEDNHFWIYNNQGEIAQHKNVNSDKENGQVQLTSENKELENREDNHFWIYNNQGEIAQHKNVNSDKENGQVQLSSENKELENREDNHFWIYNNQGEIAQHKNVNSDKENGQVQLSSEDKELENKEDNHFWIYDNEDEISQHRNGKNEKEHRQVQLSSENKDLKNKEDNHLWIYNNQGDQIAQYRNGKSEKESRQVQLLSKNKDYENKEDNQFWIYNNQGEFAQHKNGKGKKENRQIQLSSKYKDLEKKEDNHFWIYNNQGENAQQPKKENAHVHSSSPMDHMDPSLMVFFLMHDLKLGKSINVHFPRKDLSSSSSFLSKEKADSIPFSLKELPNLLQRFTFSRNSPQAKAIEDTLRECEVPPIKGETKYCATSAEAMLDFVQGIMGDKIQIKALSTTHLTKSTPLLQKYTISDVPEEVPAPKMVACHTMPYAYAIFYCHYTKSKSKVFKVSLVGENGDRVKAIAVCHLDTSEWNPKHVSFRMLGVLPGKLPICHFFPSDSPVWVPNSASTQDH